MNKHDGERSTCPTFNRSPSRKGRKVGNNTPLYAPKQTLKRRFPHSVFLGRHAHSCVKRLIYCFYETVQKAGKKKTSSSINEDDNNDGNKRQSKATSRKRTPS